MRSGLAAVSRTDGLALRQSEWNRLLSRSAVDTIFLSWEWQDLWWQALGYPSGCEQFLLVHRDGEELIGLAPLLREGTTFRFAGGEEIADFLDFIALPGREQEVANGILDCLADEQWDLLEMRNLREASLSLAYLAPEAERRGLAVAVEQEDVSPWLRLPTDWDAYLAGLSKKDRHELRRKLRRLHAAGDVRWYVARGSGERRADVADFVRLHRLSAESKAAFMTPQMEGWFQALVERFEPLGTLKLYFLEVDAVRVASAICFDYRDQILLYNSGYDPEYARLSAGLALKAYCVYDAIAAGREVFDFLQGPEPYKYDLGAVDAPIYRLRIQRT